MSLVAQRNKEAEIVYTLLYACETNGEFYNKDEIGKKQFLERKLKQIPKSKKWARNAIKRIIRSKNSTITNYVDDLLKELHANGYFEYKEYIAKFEKEAKYSGGTDEHVEEDCDDGNHGDYCEDAYENIEQV